MATGRLPMTSVDTKIGSKTSCLALPTSRYSIHQPPCAPNLVGLAQTHDSAWSPTSFLSYHLQAQWSCRIWDHRDRESWFSETLSVEVGTSGRCFVFVFLSLLLFSERAEKKSKNKKQDVKKLLEQTNTTPERVSSPDDLPCTALSWPDGIIAPSHCCSSEAEPGMKLGLSLTPV